MGNHSSFIFFLPGGARVLFLFCTGTLDKFISKLPDNFRNAEVILHGIAGLFLLSMYNHRKSFINFGIAYYNSLLAYCHDDWSLFMLKIGLQDCLAVQMSLQ